MLRARGYTFVDRYENFSLLEGGHVPAYIYAGDTTILFDPGVSAFGPLYYRKLKQVVKEHSHPLMILLTHSHFDHCGAVPYLLRKFPNARVGASILAAEVLKKPSAIDLMRRFNAEYEREMANELRGEDTSFSGVMVDLQLKEGDTVKTGQGKSLQVFETPGHTRDCLSYFFSDSGVLVAGEAAGVPDKDFIHSVFLSSYEDYANAIEKILLLKAGALCIAHAGILIGRERIAEYLNASLTAAQEYRAKLESCLERFDGDRDKVVETIVTEEYDSRSDHIQNRNPFIANLKAKINAVCKLGEQTESGDCKG